MQWARNIAPDSSYESLLIEDTMTPTSKSYVTHTDWQLDWQNPWFQKFYKFLFTVDINFKSFKRTYYYFSVLDSTENKENETVEEAGDAVLTLPDIETICGILETIAISWLGIKDQLDKVKWASWWVLQTVTHKHIASMYILIVKFGIWTYTTDCTLHSWMHHIHVDMQVVHDITT